MSILSEGDHDNLKLVQVERDFKDWGGFAELVDRLCDLADEAWSYDPEDIADDEGNPSIDCRLQYHDGQFRFWTGDASYDTDGRGHWGASSVGPGCDCIVDIAHDLIDEVLNSVAMGD